MNNFVSNLDEELKHNRILCQFNPNVASHMMTNGKNLFYPNYCQYQENFLTMESNIIALTVIIQVTFPEGLSSRTWVASLVTLLLMKQINSPIILIHL